MSGREALPLGYTGALPGWALSSFRKSAFGGKSSEKSEVIAVECEPALREAQSVPSQSFLRAGAGRLCHPPHPMEQ